MSEAKAVERQEGEIYWAGQTIRDGGVGEVLFGRDKDGGLHIRIVCDKPEGVLNAEAHYVDGMVILRWLNAWFDPPRTYVVNMNWRDEEASETSAAEPPPEPPHE